MIMYRYALNKKGERVSIEEIEESSKTEAYSCLGCSGILFPRAIKESSKIQAHFYHHVNKDLENSPKHICNPESYLHKLSKGILADNLLMKEPFILSYQENIKCINAAATSSCIKPITKEVDLSKEYPLVSVEKRDGEFIPDILLENKRGKKIYVEIYSTSAISDKKRASGHKIIQIKVYKESDIEKIVKARHINAKIKEVELIGFDAQVKTFDCEGECNYEEVKRTSSIGRYYQRRDTNTQDHIKPFKSDGRPTALKFAEHMRGKYDYEDKKTIHFSVVYKGKNLWFVSCCMEFFLFQDLRENLLYTKW